MAYDPGGEFVRLRLEVSIDHIDYCLGKLSFKSDGVVFGFLTIIDWVAMIHRRFMFNSEADLLCRLINPIWCLLWISWFSPKGREETAVQAS